MKDKNLVIETVESFLLRGGKVQILKPKKTKTKTAIRHAKKQRSIRSN